VDLEWMTKLDTFVIPGRLGWQRITISARRTSAEEASKCRRAEEASTSAEEASTSAQALLIKIVSSTDQLHSSLSDAIAGILCLNMCAVFDHPAITVSFQKLK
jgi:hypothetical protein